MALNCVPFMSMPLLCWMTEGLNGEGLGDLDVKRVCKAELGPVGTERLMGRRDGESGDSSLGRGDGECQDMVVRSKETCGVRMREGTAVDRGRLAACVACWAAMRDAELGLAD